MAATWNPSDRSGVTLSGSNLIATTTGAGGVRSTLGFSTGKYYWEYTLGVFDNGSSGVGVASSTATLSSMGSTVSQAALVYPAGVIYINGVNTGVSIGTHLAGSIIPVALDIGAKLVWFRSSPSGFWNSGGSANPATGVGGLSVSALVSPLFAGFGCAISGQAMTANFGDSAFIGTVPSGFTSGLSAPPTAGQITQVALEQWSQGQPVAQATQVAVEQWAVLAIGDSQAIVSQVALEQWAAVQTAAAVAEQYAVSVIT
jgi:hypothetical protein